MPKNFPARIIWSGLALGVIIVVASLALRLDSEPGEPLPPDFEDFAESGATDSATADGTSLATPDPTAILNAIDSRDETECAALANSDEVLDCRQNITRLTALEKKDPFKCNELAGTKNAELCRDEVYFSLALGEKQVATCAKIVSAESRKRCEEIVSKF